MANKIKNYFKEHEKRWLITGIIFAMFMWGLSWPAGKIVSAYGSAASIGLIRYIVIFFSMLTLLLIFRINLKVKLQGFGFLILSGVLLTIYNFVFLNGLQLGYAGAGGVLVTTTNPLFAYLLGLIISKKTPSKMESLGLLIGLIAGAFLLNIWLSFDKIIDSGNLYFLSGSLLWAAMSKVTSKAGNYGTSFAFSLWMYFITMICFTAISDWHEVKNIIVTGDSFFWLVMLYFGMGGAAIATSVYFFATTRLGAEKASSFIFLVPFSAAVSSFIFLGEIIYLHTIIGGVLGMIAVFMINKRGPRSNEKFN